MPRSSPTRPPKLRRLATGRAYVHVDGRRTYLGPWPTPGRPPKAAADAHAAFVADWYAEGCRAPVAEADPAEAYTVE